MQAVRSKETDWYGEYIKDEMSFLENSLYTGNVTFRVDVKGGKVLGIATGINKCVRMPKEEEDAG